MKRNKLLALLTSGLLTAVSIPNFFVSAYGGFYDNPHVKIWTGYDVEGCWKISTGCIDSTGGYKKNDEGKYVYVNGEINDRIAEYPKGDIDMDGVLTEHDIILFTHAFYVPLTEPNPLENPDVFFYGADFEEYTGGDEMLIFCQMFLADVNEDGIVNLEDLELLKESVQYKAGDVNQDGEITVDDASLILNEYAKKSAGLGETFTEEQKNLADMNGKLFKTNADKVDSATVDNASSVLERYARQAAGLPAVEGDSVLANYLG